jgi:hypothetical protein
MQRYPHAPRVLRALSAAVAVAFFAGCGDDGGSASDDQPTVTLELADAPGDLAHAWVEITEIALQGTGGTTVLLDSSTGLVDLLTLAMTTKELIADVPVPAGTYSQLRIVIGAGVIESEAGEVFALAGAQHPDGIAATGRMQCPSCAQSGLKINLPDGGLSLDTEAVVLVLDFDVSQSFGKERGNSGRWVMRPKITASEVGASGTVEGTVALAEGVTLPACGGERTLADFVPMVTAVDDSSQVKTGLVDPDGSYRVRFVAPGTYSVSFAETVEFDVDTLSFAAVAPSASEVGVVVGQAAVVDYTISSVTCR